MLLEFLGRMSETEVSIGNVLSAVRHSMEGVRSGTDLGYGRFLREIGGRHES